MTKSKSILTFSLLSILSVLFLVGIASAVTLSSFAITAPATITSSATSFPISFTLTNTGAAGTVDLTSAFTSSQTGTIALSSTSVAMADGSVTPTTANITGTVTVVAGKVGTFAATITAKESTTTLQTSTLSVPVEFGTNGTQGTDLVLRGVSISSDGADDEEWSRLDTITVNVELKNVGSGDIDDVFVELGLFDSEGNDVTSELDFLNEDEESIDAGNFNDGDSDEVNFEFKLPADFAEGNYNLAVKAYSDDLGENVACADSHNDMSKLYYEDVEVVVDEDNPIVVDDIVLSKTSATAGDLITLTFKVYNLGDSDEDQVRVNIASTTLGIAQSQEIRNFDIGDGEKAELTFTVPATLAAGKYIISFEADYDYDSRNDEYDKSSDDTWTATLDVTGAPIAPSAELNVAVSAELDSDAKAGEQMTVVATIKNNEATSQTIVVDAKNFASWAELDSISDRLVTINAGESKEVTFTFNVNDDAQGEQSFSIETIAGAKSETKEVAVTVEESASLFSGLKGNSMLWIIGAINVVLIVLIIVVAVRLSRK